MSDPTPVPRPLPAAAARLSLPPGLRELRLPARPMLAPAAGQPFRPLRPLRQLQPPRPLSWPHLLRRTVGALQCGWQPLPAPPLRWC